jgi:C1A family cysteine protease
MIFNRGKKLKIICSLIILFIVALMPLGSVSDLRAEENETFQMAPINPEFLEFWGNPPEPFYGYVPPPIDLSHLDEIPVERLQKAATLPSEFDWRDTGKVTSVKNQNPCGTCWCFGTTSVLESAVLIGEDTGYDFSEQSVALCVDRSWVSRYDDSTDPCLAGGWSWLAAEVFIRKGAVLESCNPYNTGELNCDGTCVCDSCPPIKKVNGYRLVTDDKSQTALIKEAVYNHGPVTMVFYHDEAHEYTHPTYGTVYDCATCTSTNHLVSIIGWDDSVPHFETPGTGAWLVKNSWGTGWGNSGYFWLPYNSSCMREIAYLEYEDYDSNEQLYYWDEAGSVTTFGNWADYSGWMANIFSSTQDGNLTHVDFWTTSNNAAYNIYVYLDGNISDGLQNLATSQSGTCQEYGYYSIPLSSPVSLNNGQSFTIAVEMTTPGYKYPLPAECELVIEETTIVDPAIQTGKSFYKHTTGDSWTDGAAFSTPLNFCLRGRVSTGGAGQPDITVSPPSFDVTRPPDTIQDYTLTIGNDGDAVLTHTISDRETTGEGSAVGGESLFAMGPASMVLEVPLESRPVLSQEDTGEALAGWQNIMTEGFEGAFPGIWDVHRSTGYTDAYWGKDSYNPHSGAYSAFCAKSGTAGVNPPANYPNDMYAWMIYGPFSLADASDAELNFWHWLDTEYEYDYLYSWASIDGEYFYGWYYTGDFGGWVSQSFDLTDVYTLGNLCGQSQVWIAFIFESDDVVTDKGAFIDDVVLRKYVAGVNNPPNPPSSPSPANHATGVSVNTDLSWTGGDPDVGDTVTYDVYFDTTGATTLVSNDQSATTYDPGTLNSNTKYYWKIVATDNHGAPTSGTVWDFTTTSTSEDCLWLDENPKLGLVPVGGSNDITVTINTAGLTVGNTYTAEIVIANNDPDPDDNPKVVPVTLHIASGANNPPNIPSGPSPANHATGVSINTDLSWTGGDPDIGDTVTYDVYFDTTGATTLVSNDQSATTYDPGTLNVNTKYYWKIVATDNHGAPTSGPLWDFTTQAGAGPTVTWNCPLGGQPLIAPYPGAGRPFLSVPAGCTGITASAGAALWGIYHLVETGPSAGTWLYYIPGFVASTLTQLEPGEYYLVVVSAFCTLTIPQ